MSALTVVSPTDGLERENAKLRRIVEVLMKRVEQDTDETGAGYGLFQTAVALEAKVRSRTRDLQEALEKLNSVNARLEAAKAEAEDARAALANALEAVQEGFALFSPDGRLVMCNSRFGAVTPDVLDRIKAGVRFEDYVRAISRSRYLALREGTTPDSWMRWRLEAHRASRAHITVQFTGDRWVQVSEQRTPDGGYAILQTDITELVRAERQERNKLLDDQARLVRATLDHIIQGVCIFDADPASRRLERADARAAGPASDAAAPGRQLRGDRRPHDRAAGDRGPRGATAAPGLGEADRPASSHGAGADPHQRHDPRRLLPADPRRRLRHQLHRRHRRARRDPRHARDQRDAREPRRRTHRGASGRPRPGRAGERVQDALPRLGEPRPASAAQRRQAVHRLARGDRTRPRAEADRRAHPVRLRQRRDSAGRAARHLQARRGRGAAAHHRVPAVAPADPAARGVRRAGGAERAVAARGVLGRLGQLGCGLSAARDPESRGQCRALHADGHGAGRRAPAR